MLETGRRGPGVRGTRGGPRCPAPDSQRWGRRVTGECSRAKNTAKRLYYASGLQTQGSQLSGDGTGGELAVQRVHRAGGADPRGDSTNRIGTSDAPRAENQSPVYEPRDVAELGADGPVAAGPSGSEVTSGAD